MSSAAAADGAPPSSEAHHTSSRASATDEGSCVSAPLRQAWLRPSPSSQRPSSQLRPSPSVHAGRQWVASGHDPLGMTRTAAAADEEAASNAALNASLGADVGGAAALEVPTTALEVPTTALVVSVLLQLPTTAPPYEATLATLRHLIAQLSWSASAVPGTSAVSGTSALRAHLEPSAGQPSGLAARPTARVPPTWQLLLLSARPLCSEPPELVDLIRQLPTVVHLAPAREREPSAVPGATGGLDESVVSGADQSVVSGVGEAADKRAPVLLGARPTPLIASLIMTSDCLPHQVLLSARPMPAQDTMAPVTAPLEAPPTPLSAEVRRVWDLCPDCL